MQQDIRKSIDEGAMGRFQWLAVAICVMLLMLDGFDVLVMAFTASSISAEWHLTGAQLGVLFSAGLVGMAAGSLLLAPQADRYGRQTIILVCLALITVGMLLSALAQSSLQLGLLRALTGVGIGGMLASVGVITAEYSSHKWRSTCVAFQATGYPIGATLGGMVAAMLMTHYGWRSVFVFGGLTTLLMVPVVLRLLPESVDFLLAKQPQDALGKLNTLLRKMQRPVLQSLPARPVPVAGVAPVGGFKSLFSPAILRSTLLIWSAFFLLMFSFYFALSWTPKLLVAAGLSAQQGITGGVLLNLGGIVGGTLFGVLASRLDLGRLTAACLAITAVAMAVFGFVTGTLDLAFMAAFGIGMFIFGGMAGLYSFAPIIYPAAVRTTGMGWAIGIGRMGAILAPLTAGVLLDSGWAPPQLYYVFAIPLLLAVVAVLAIRAKAPAAGRASGTLAAAH